MLGSNPSLRCASLAPPLCAMTLVPRSTFGFCLCHWKGAAEAKGQVQSHRSLQGSLDSSVLLPVDCFVP